MLIADSWFGSVACAVALYKHAIFAVMNVKTAHKGYPKDDLMEVVGEIKGNTSEAKRLRAERRGKQAAFRQIFSVDGGRQVTLVAAGHNKKVPLLLICTYSTMLPGDVHHKTWTCNCADGTTQTFRRETKQPKMHALYRKHMNVVDLHNKLRQGVVAMADIWQTTSWIERHFAEGLGLWEVNIYKALMYFLPAKWGQMSHSEFRARLAFELMTLGQARYPADLEPSESARAPFSSPNTTTCPPPQALIHEWVNTENRRVKRCTYCGKATRKMCFTCSSTCKGDFYACVPGSGRTCMADHVEGKKGRHHSFCKGKNKRCRQDGDESSSNLSSDLFSGSESDAQPRPARRDSASATADESPNSRAMRDQRARQGGRGRGRGAAVLAASSSSS